MQLTKPRIFGINATTLASNEDYDLAVNACKFVENASDCQIHLYDIKNGEFRINLFDSACLQSAAPFFIFNDGTSGLVTGTIPSNVCIHFNKHLHRDFFGPWSCSSIEDANVAYLAGKAFLDIISQCSVHGKVNIDIISHFHQKCILETSCLEDLLIQIDLAAIT